jgi:excisionase family DNA binding protein
MSLGLSTLKLLIANGKLRSLKVGKRRLVPVSAIDDSVREFLAASQTEPKRAT